MSGQYTKLHNPNRTPQTVKAKPNQVQNYAGGFVFQLDPMKQLERFLILGSDSNTYYASAQTLTRKNAEVVEQCWLTRPMTTAELIIKISVEGRAARQDPALFALALGALSSNVTARRAAYNAVQHVCRIPTHLFTWVKYCSDMGKGNGRGMTRAIAIWYKSRETDKLAYTMVKYQNRVGYNHQRLIHKANQGPLPGAANDEDGVKRRMLYNWANGKPHIDSDLPQIVQAFKEVVASNDPKVWVKGVIDHNLPWEALPTQAMKVPAVWEALAPNMGMTALIRNLANMTECGAIDPLSSELNSTILKRLNDEEELRKARIHPFNVLLALTTYASGQGFRGSKSWSPNQKIVKALNEAFYKSFKYAESTNKRIMLAVDISGSMGGSKIMNTNIDARQAAAAMSLITEATEPNTAIFGFCTSFMPLAIHSRQSLEQVAQYMRKLHMGGTDCALPMQHALKNGLKVDTFIVYTDSETWSGRTQHPFQALQEYRKKTGIPAKLIVVAFTSTGFSIADPSDPGMLDVVGFDANAPLIMAEFIKSSIAV